MEQTDVRRLAGALGAEIRGIDLKKPTDALFERVKSLLEEHLVLFFPDQNLSVAEHVKLGQGFGELEGQHPSFPDPNAPDPHVYTLRASQGGIADDWHTDLTFQRIPPLMSILNMKTSPPFGGDTMWANLIAAYEALSPPLREMCDGLTALHDAACQGRPEASAIHPVVRLHPATGAKALFVNTYFTRRIVELHHGESDALLGHLTRWVQDPRFTVRYKWTEGCIGMWDNRVTQHYVLNDFSGERVIQRVTVLGRERPEGPGAKWPSAIENWKLSAVAYHDFPLVQHFEREKAEAESIA